MPDSSARPHLQLLHVCRGEAHGVGHQELLRQLRAQQHLAQLRQQRHAGQDRLRGEGGRQAGGVETRPSLHAMHAMPAYTWLASIVYGHGSNTLLLLVLLYCCRMCLACALARSAMVSPSSSSLMMMGTAPAWAMRYLQPCMHAQAHAQL